MVIAHVKAKEKKHYRVEDQVLPPRAVFNATNLHMANKTINIERSKASSGNYSRDYKGPIHCDGKFAHIDLRLGGISEGLTAFFSRQKLSQITHCLKIDENHLKYCL